MNSALTASEKSSTTYAPPMPSILIASRAGPESIASVMIGIMVASRPRPATVAVIHFLDSSRNRSSSRTMHTTADSTISGASAW
jgi:hypothetical protein